MRERGRVRWTCLWKIVLVDPTVRFRYPLQLPLDCDAALRAERDAEKELLGDVRDRHQQRKGETRTTREYVAPMVTISQLFVQA